MVQQFEHTVAIIDKLLEDQTYTVDVPAATRKYFKSQHAQGGISAVRGKLAALSVASAAAKRLRATRPASRRRAGGSKRRKPRKKTTKRKRKWVKKPKRKPRAKKWRRK